MKLFDNIKVGGCESHQFGSIVDFVDDEQFLIEAWEIKNDTVQKCSMLVFHKDKLRKLTFTEKMEFKRLMDEYYKKSFG